MNTCLIDFFLHLIGLYKKQYSRVHDLQKVDTKRIGLRKRFRVSEFRENKIFRERKLRSLEYFGYQIPNRKRGNGESSVLGLFGRVYSKPEWIPGFNPNRSKPHYTKNSAPIGFFTRSEPDPTRFYRCGFGSGYRVRIICPPLSTPPLILLR